MMYESPITLLRRDVEAKIEGEVLTAAYNVGVTVDRDELIKALQYDREQYRKGYQDATPKWISVDEGLPETNDWVLVWYRDKDGDYFPTVGKYNSRGNYWITDADDSEAAYPPDKITHWMPLPEPPHKK